MAQNTLREIFPKRLKEARRRRGLTQTTLGRRTHIPISSIEKFETGARLPSADSLRVIAAALNVSSDYLLGVIDTLQIIDNSFSYLLRFLSGDDYEAVAELIKFMANRNKGNRAG